MNQTILNYPDRLLETLLKRYALFLGVSFIISSILLALSIDPVKDILQLPSVMYYVVYVCIVISVVYFVYTLCVHSSNHVYFTDSTLFWNKQTLPFSAIEKIRFLYCVHGDSFLKDTIKPQVHIHFDLEKNNIPDLYQGYYPAYTSSNSNLGHTIEYSQTMVIPYWFDNFTHESIAKLVNLIKFQNDNLAIEGSHEEMVKKAEQLNRLPSKIVEYIILLVGLIMISHPLIWNIVTR